MQFFQRADRASQSLAVCGWLQAKGWITPYSLVVLHAQRRTGSLGREVVQLTELEWPKYRNNDACGQTPMIICKYLKTNSKQFKWGHRQTIGNVFDRHYWNVKCSRIFYSTLQRCKDEKLKKKTNHWDYWHEKILCVRLSDHT